MTTFSPTPFAPSAFVSYKPSQHLSSRPLPKSRPVLRRHGHSPISVLEHGHGFSANAPVLQDITYGDSSDDDIPPPPHFSALTQAHLEDKPSTRGPLSQQEPISRARQASPSDKRYGASRTGTPLGGSIRVTRKPDSVSDNERVSPPRVVHLSGSRGSSAKKAYSFLDESIHEPQVKTRAQHDLVTPAPMPRKRPAMSRVNSAYSNGPSSHSSAVNHSGRSSDYHTSSYASTQPTSAERDGSSLEEEPAQPKDAGAVMGSVRIKRGGLGQGTLRGAPMRRPFRPRSDDEGQSPDGEPMSASRLGDHDALIDTGLPSRSLHASSEHVDIQDFGSVRNELRKIDPPLEPVRQSERQDSKSTADIPSARSHISELPPMEKQAVRPVQEKPVFRMPAPPPSLPFHNDQENEPPPTFKRNKAQSSSILGNKLSILDEGKELKMLAETPAANAQPRQALAMRSINTPQRAAPPPPKMSVIDTATTNAGASTVKKKKRTHITLNGKAYSLRGRLGKGGTSDVYRVMAENDKMFALKRVSLKDAAEDTIRGYKGEIDLLKKLENVERVVRLFDWEVNEQKQSLDVLMEIGESDLNRILNTRIHPDDGKFDISFTRHYWREMLECVSAVHAYDIVHSDLKPANFLLVQGRLKLIDFGIANSIDTDNTVNVHRDTNVGTPNYMSPESLQDTNADQRAAAGGASVGKLMKIGKPSDVWSLGIILYQMTYGKPPFAHIANQWNRCMAIVNPSVQISYPDTGIGGVPVPSSLKRLIKSCLNRDSTQRPTVEQLLNDREPFLNPDAQMEKWEAQGAVPVTEHVLEQILMKIVERCRDPSRGIPTDDEVKVYPKAFLDRVRSLQRV